nr:MAG TPA: hypothetical protein [Caudoviricetes sp.]DAT63569.1 MAG TPA: hypothetical protein [Caudoviricetes sp.]
MLCSSHSQFLYDKYHEPHRHRSLSERWSSYHKKSMIIFRNKHGSFKGGLIKTKISPTITTASFEHNTFILKIKECATKL